MAIKIYADGADIQEILDTYRNKTVDGFTTNPSLMKQAGVSDYKNFAKTVISQISDLPVSFEVFGDEFNTMKKEALLLSDYGKNVFVKIPIQNTKGESSLPLIQELSSAGINLNITAIFTVKQVRDVCHCVCDNSKTIVSVFAGRIADTGIDPMPIMKESAAFCHQKNNVFLLWASTREIFNLVQAEKTNCDIITIPPHLLKKKENFGMDLNQRSLETVQDFSRDIRSLGFSIL